MPPTGFVVTPSGILSGGAHISAPVRARPLGVRPSAPTVCIASRRTQQRSGEGAKTDADAAIADAGKARPAAAPSRRGLAAWQVKRVDRYMRDNLPQEIGLQELADLVDLSRFHFCRAFRMATGSSPHEWLAQLRIEAAQHLLANPRLRVADIGLVVGYRSPSAFTAAFRRVAGVTPREFRRTL